MERRGVDFIFHTTDKTGDAEKIAAECVSKKSRAVVVTGGDGSVQEAAGALAGSGIPLGIIPAGSGNDFVASVYGGKNRDPLFFLEKILRGEKRKIDLIRCAVGEAGQTEHFFANIGSVGLDAEIVNKADDFKKTFGRFAYIVSTVYNAFTHKPCRISAEADGYSVNESLCLVSVCNGGVYGGGFKIAPFAVPDDGLITLCVIKPLSKIKILALFPSVLIGRHVDFKEVYFHSTKKVRIEYDGVKKLNLDGNIFYYESPVSFAIAPAALTIFK